MYIEQPHDGKKFKPFCIVIETLEEATHLIYKLGEKLLGRNLNKDIYLD